WFRMPPNEPLYYPIYARCVELDIPIMMQVGQNLIYQKEVRLPSVAKPILLDQVAIDFPDLKLIGIHIGVPWTDEMIAMAWKHENVYIGIDAYAPKHLPASLKHYMNSYGSHKVLFGTDWPVIDPERGVREMQDHQFRDGPYEQIMRTNALKVFDFDRPRGRG
ncbi:MAG: amidohydrolase family protein, partial [Pseudomonadota bacterium]